MNVEHDFKDHLIDRELREVLAGDGPPADLGARVQAAVSKAADQLVLAAARDFSTQVIDRELEEMLGDDGPPADLAARVLAAVAAKRRALGGIDSIDEEIGLADPVPQPQLVAAPPPRAVSGVRSSNGNGRVRGSDSGRKGNHKSGRNGSAAPARPGTRQRSRATRSNNTNVRWLAPAISVAAAVLILVVAGVMLGPGNGTNTTNTASTQQSPIINEWVPGNGKTPGSNQVVQAPNSNGRPQPPDGMNASGNAPEVVDNTPLPSNNRPTDPRDPRDPRTNTASTNNNSGPIVPPNNGGNGGNGGNGSTVDANANRPPTNDPVPPGPPVQPGPIDPQPRDHVDPPRDNSAPPTPDPKDPTPAPQPGPDNPADPGTRPMRPVLATVSGTSRLARVKVKSPEPGSDWESIDETKPFEVVAGAALKTAGTVDLDLATGGLLRFDGEITIAGDSDRVLVSIQKDNVYVDNLGGSGLVSVGVGDTHVGLVRDGIAFFEGHSGWLEVSSIHGEVDAGGQRLAAMRMMVLRDRGNEEKGANPNLFGLRFFKDLPGRLVLRDDFDQDGAVVEVPLGNVQAGALSALRRDGLRAELLFHRVELIGTEILRVKFRFSRPGTRLAVMAGSKANRLQANAIMPPGERDGEWIVAEIPLDQLIIRGNGKREGQPQDPPRRGQGGGGNPPPGGGKDEQRLARGMQIDGLIFSAAGDGLPENLELQIDWFEIVRKPN